MLLVDNETIAAVHHRFTTSGKAEAIAELRRRFWLLDAAAADGVERLLAWAPDGLPGTRTGPRRLAEVRAP